MVSFSGLDVASRPHLHVELQRLRLPPVVTVESAAAARNWRTGMTIDLGGSMKVGALNRRAFLSTLAAIIVADPHVAETQHALSAGRIGVFFSGSPQTAFERTWGRSEFPR
jgi:hypothetical protein